MVVKAVGKSFKSYYQEPYLNYLEVPQHVTDRWWRHFRERFSWDPSVADDVKKEYKSKCYRCITNMIHKVSIDPEYKEDWLSKPVRDAIMKKRGTTSFKKKLEQCLKNHLGGRVQT